MGGPVNMVQDGKSYAVPEDQVQAALSQGYHLETPDEDSSRNVDVEKEDVYGGAAGATTAAILGLSRGVTLGASDVLADSMGLSDQVRETRDHNSKVSLGAEILGGLSGSGPAGALSDAGTATAALGEGSNLAGRVGWKAAGGALEGAGQAGGSYVSSVALDDKPLSAEGFVGAMGKGAMFGGGAAGVLGLGEETLMRAKALFPRHEVTKAAAEEVAQNAQSAMTTVADDSRAMQSVAKQELERLRVEQAKTRLATEEQAGELRLRTEASKLERQEAMTSRAKAGPAPRTRKAFDAPEVPVSAPETAAPLTHSAPAGDDLMAQLAGTKSALDNGADLAGLSHGAPPGGDFAAAARSRAGDLVHTPESAKLADAVAANESALNEYDAWLAKYGKTSSVAKTERKFATDDWIENARSKGPGWVEKVPEGEGNALLRRGKQMEWRGGEAERQAAEAAITSKVSPEEQIAARAKVDEIAGRMPKRNIGAEVVDGATSAAKDVGADVLASAAPKPTVEQSIQGALRPHVGEHVNIEPDIAEAAKIIGNVEKTSADLAEVLGPAAPAAATERAAQFRDAVAAHADQAAHASVKAGEDVATKLVPEVARATGKAPTGELLSKLGDLGAGLEVLKAIGVGVPDLEKIPVIGPVLSLYLKARAAMGVFKRAGGAVPKTAESVIAAKAASTRNRVNESVQRMLDIGAKATRGAARGAGPMGALGYKLFPGGKAEGKTPVEQYRARIDELARAAQPNALRKAVNEVVPTSDPALQQEIGVAMERKLAFLTAKAPRELKLPTLLKGDGDWSPSKIQLEQFARYMKAAEDPASVLEDVAHGQAPSMEAAETLRMVYPSLFREAQMMLVQRASTMQNTLPYTRRITLSVLFQVPVDGSMSPDNIQFLQQGAPAAAHAPGQGSPVAGAPPTPTISGPVAMADRTMTALDRRAGA